MAAGTSLRSSGQSASPPVRREDGSVSLQAVRVGCCYAAPALLDGTVPHAGPELAAKLIGRTADTPPIPVAAISKHVVLAGILGREDPGSTGRTSSHRGLRRSIAELATSGLRGRRPAIRSRRSGRPQARAGAAICRRQRG